MIYVNLYFPHVNIIYLYWIKYVYIIMLFYELCWFCAKHHCIYKEQEGIWQQQSIRNPTKSI